MALVSIFLLFVFILLLKKEPSVGLFYVGIVHGAQELLSSPNQLTSKVAGNMVASKAICIMENVK